MINRRQFLGAAAFAATTPVFMTPEFFGTATEPLLEIAKWEQGPELFMPVSIEIGQTPEFPLDFFGNNDYEEMPPVIMSAKGCVSIDGSVRYSQGVPYVMIPTYDIGSATDWPNSMDRNHGSGKMMELGVKNTETSIANSEWVDQWLTIVGETNRRDYYNSREFSHKNNPPSSLEAMVEGNNNDLKWTHFFCGEDATLTDIPDWITVVRLAGLNKYYKKGNSYTTGECIIRNLIVGKDGIPDMLTTPGIWRGRCVIQSDQDVGIVLRHNPDERVKVIREPRLIFPDDSMPKQRRSGCYGWTEVGFASLRPNATRCFFG